MSHELFITTRQKTKIGNDLANNPSTDIKLSKSHLAIDILPKLATKATSSASRKGAVGAGEAITLFISNKNINHFIKITESSEISRWCN